MRFTKHLSMKKTKQRMAIPGAGQVQNSAGGFVWTADSWSLLDRFLILGTEGGTYYIGEHKLTRDNAKNVMELIKLDGEKVVTRIVEVSESGRAPKNDAAIFALALCASFGETPVRQAAFAAVPRVCRTGTHLFQFISETEELRGWGRGLRKAVQRWYTESSAEDLAYQAMKYQQRGGWSHRDLLRLSHPKATTQEHNVIFKWIVDGVLTGTNDRIEAFERLKKTDNPKAAAKIIRDHKLTRECVPTELLIHTQVWEALLESMPMTAMIRNLANMTRCGLLEIGSSGTKMVIERLKNEQALRRARVHPLAILLAQATYARGQGFRGQHSWMPVPKIVDALDEAFYKAFANAEPTGKRFLLGVDVSGSMSSYTVAGTPLTACEAATAMAMVTVATEDSVRPMAFNHGLQPLPISGRMRLDDALRHTRNVNFGGTDCALPMITATKHKWPVDVFVVYTDNETWFGHVHPAQALEEYRQKMGIPAKLVVMGMCANQFTIADPRDQGMLDVVGFDAAVPQAMREFALS